MTDDRKPTNDKPGPLGISETERGAEFPPTVREFGASTDDTVSRGIDVDAYYAKKTSPLAGGRRRRSYGIL